MDLSIVNVEFGRGFEGDETLIFALLVLADIMRHSKMLLQLLVVFVVYVLVLRPADEAVEVVRHVMLYRLFIVE